MAGEIDYGFRCDRQTSDRVLSASYRASLGQVNKETGYRETETTDRAVLSAAYQVGPFSFWTVTNSMNPEGGMNNLWNELAAIKSYGQMVRDKFVRIGTMKRWQTGGTSTTRIY
jgi:hypothetical protein